MRCFSLLAFSQEGSLGTTFNTRDVGFGDKANDQVRSILVQGDRKTITVGDFTSYNGKTANRIARLNSDGSFDYL